MFRVSSRGSFGSKGSLLGRQGSFSFRKGKRRLNKNINQNNSSRSSNSIGNASGHHSKSSNAISRMRRNKTPRFERKVSFSNDIQIIPKNQHDAVGRTMGKQELREQIQQHEQQRGKLLLFSENSTWYTQHELKQMKSYQTSLSKKIETLQQDESLPSSSSLLLLEEYFAVRSTQEISDCKQIWRKSVKTVLAEQTVQRKVGCCDPLCISIRYERYSRPCQKAAIVRGLDNASQVEEYLQNTRNQWPHNASSALQKSSRNRSNAAMKRLAKNMLNWGSPSQQQGENNNMIVN